MKLWALCQKTAGAVTENPARLFVLISADLVYLGTCAWAALPCRDCSTAQAKNCPVDEPIMGDSYGTLGIGLHLLVTGGQCTGQDDARPNSISVGAFSAISCRIVK